MLRFSMDSILTINIGGLYYDPTEWNGKNKSCEHCDKDVEYDSDYCEDHQPCYYCGETLHCVDNGKYCKEDVENL